STARPSWKPDGYIRNVVEKYSVTIVGWPWWIIPFRNLSDLGSAQDTFNTLLLGWREGSIRFVRLSPDE
ncbi:hypothetical protein FA95DRAFT_1468923, partial [Auriscalpium vulgare]